MLSLIIPVYNEEKHVRDFVNHLIRIKFTIPVEFIFVDDGSSDGTVNALNELKRLYKLS